MGSASYYSAYCNTNIRYNKEVIFGPFCLARGLKKDQSFHTLLLLFPAFYDSFECFYNSNMGLPLWIIVLEMDILETWFSQRNRAFTLPALCFGTKHTVPYLQGLIITHNTRKEIGL